MNPLADAVAERRRAKVEGWSLDGAGIRLREVSEADTASGPGAFATGRGSFRQPTTSNASAAQIATSRMHS